MPGIVGLTKVDSDEDRVCPAHLFPADLVASRAQFVPITTSGTANTETAIAVPAWASIIRVYASTNGVFVDLATATRATVSRKTAATITINDLTAGSMCRADSLETRRIVPGANATLYIWSNSTSVDVDVEFIGVESDIY